MTLSDAGKERLSGPLGGDACVDGPLEGVAVETMPDGRFTIALGSTEECTSAVVELLPSDGVVGLPED